MNRFLQLFYLLIFIFIAVLYFSFAQTEHTNLKIISYNIRYAGSVEEHGEYAWEFRKDNIKSLIQYYQPDIIGMQEVLKIQLDYFNGELKNYKFVGVGREDGKEKGEYSPIFYKSDKFELIESSTFWLSETPDSISKGWDAALERIATWAKFRDKNNDEFFYCFNTHFDHIGKLARLQSIKLISNRIKSLSDSSSVILTGDFNFESNSEPYKYITQFGSPLIDTKTISRKKHYGDIATFNGFGNIKKKIEIDFIFCTKNFEVLSHAVIDDKFQDKYPSDHMPVIVEMTTN